MSDHNELTLTTITAVLSSIQRVVAGFYGPQCLQTLLTSQTGKAVVTSDGYTILQTLQPYHPVANLVTRAIYSCHGYTQDGTKTFLTYLTSFFNILEREVTLGKYCHSGVNLQSVKTALHKEGVIGATQSVHVLIQTVLPKLIEQLTEHSMQLQKKLKTRMSNREILAGVCRTTLSAHFNPRLCNHFAEYLINLLPDTNDIDLFGESLRLCIQHFNMMAIKVAKRPYNECSEIRPYLLRGNLALNCLNTIAAKEDTYSDMIYESCNTKRSSNVLKALVLRSCIDGSDCESEVKETFHVGNQQQMIDIIQHRRKVVAKFVDKCVEYEVNILLCTEAIPKYALDVFRNHGISVMSNILPEDIELIELFTGKQSLSTVHEILTVDDKNIILLEGVERVNVGGQNYVHLKLTADVTVKHPIICGPTVGLCDQASMMLYKALNSALLCIEDIGMECNGLKNIKPKTNGADIKHIRIENQADQNLTKKSVHTENIETCQEISSDCISANCHSNSKCDSAQISALNGDILETNNTSRQLVVIEGGGGFEVLLSRLLQDYKATCVDASTALMCDILRETLESVLGQLYTNGISKTSTRRLIEVKNVLQEKADAGIIWGINRRGVPCDLGVKGVFEPLSSKLHVLKCVLSLAAQILKIDKIVSVKKLNADES